MTRGCGQDQAMPSAIARAASHSIAPRDASVCVTGSKVSTAAVSRNPRNHNQRNNNARPPQAGD